MDVEPFTEATHGKLRPAWYPKTGNSWSTMVESSISFLPRAPLTCSRTHSSAVTVHVGLDRPPPTACPALPKKNEASSPRVQRRLAYSSTTVFLNVPTPATLTS